MKIKGIFATRPASVQLFVFLLFLSAGALLASLLSAGLIGVTQGANTDITQNAGLMRFVQLVTSICTFLLPSLAMAWTCGTNPTAYLSLRKVANGEVWLLTLLSMFLLSPAINLLGLLNQQMELPAFMAPIEHWMRTQEDLAERLTLKLLSNDSPWTLLANLLVIAGAAGVTEEFLFRGALQRVIGRWTANPHTVIWIAAALFSAFHIQFYGFLPRMLLGAYFGYLLYWGKSIWIPVFAHFCNNAFAVIGMSSESLKETEFVTGDIPPEHLLDFSLMAAGATLLFLLVNRRLKRIL